MCVILEILEFYLFDYILLCGILSNPSGRLVDRLPICMNGVDGVHYWFSYCLLVAWGLALELPHYLLVGVLDRALIRRVRTFAFYDMYLCCLLRLIVDLCLRFDILLVIYWDLRHSCWDFVICCWDNSVWWFFAASFWKYICACFEIIDDVASKLFQIFDLLH